MCWYVVAYQSKSEEEEKSALEELFQASFIFIYPGLCLISSTSASYVKEAILQIFGHDTPCLVAKLGSDHDYALSSLKHFPQHIDLEFLLPQREGHIS